MSSRLILKFWGAPVFKGTRVPIDTQFDDLKEGIALDEFLSDFPTAHERRR
ncbi:MAG: DUF433 domain-containing protein [Cyclobacteriaceae bacterium]|jgi:uncharacterized protein (DUF433 family)|nr:DUF433 domain-containing protein [Cyclobacteriaceae bacterium]